GRCRTGRRPRRSPRERQGNRPCEPRGKAEWGGQDRPRGGPPTCYTTSALDPLSSCASVCPSSALTGGQPGRKKCRPNFLPSAFVRRMTSRRPGRQGRGVRDAEEAGQDRLVTIAPPS